MLRPHNKSFRVHRSVLLLKRLLDISPNSIVGMAQQIKFPQFRNVGNSRIEIEFSFENLHLFSLVLYCFATNLFSIEGGCLFSRLSIHNEENRHNDFYRRYEFFHPSLKITIKKLWWSSNRHSPSYLTDKFPPTTALQVSQFNFCHVNRLLAWTICRVCSRNLFTMNFLKVSRTRRVISREALNLTSNGSHCEQIARKSCRQARSVLHTSTSIISNGSART